ncbi:sym-1 [Halteromyces radiatus]|uniref:sym-1 n=1 Tax=Halteromyces radiatus TaxID=101107 RepID=UPI002220F6F2|nr:sym-1 [Halteromyces radiatus]KAI8079725.1 sym-1 [Halteromyces radiatus]
MISLYNRLLSKYPIFVQSISTSCLFGTGDLIAQQLIEKQGLEKHDMARTGRMMIFGGLVAGPALSNWYRVLEHNVKGSTPVKALLKKVAVDQFLCAPVFIGVFFSVQGWMEGKSVEEIKQKLDHGYTTAVINNYKLWPAVQLVNFYFIPLNHRLMMTNLVALGWNSYLSWINHRSSQLADMSLTTSN